MMTLAHSSFVNINNLDEEEVKILDYLRSERADLEHLYIKNIKNGRRGILNRLLQAFVREHFIDAKQISWRDNETGKVLHIKLSKQKTLKVKVKKTHLLGMFDINGEIVLLQGDDLVVIEHPVKLLDLLKEEDVIEGDINDEQFQRFRKEIQNSTANFALALAGAEQRTIEMAQEMNHAPLSSSLKWVQQKIAEDPWFSPLSFYEQWVVDGHTIHPCSKTKFGLAVSDVIRYSPEWGSYPEIALAAVRKTRCNVTTLKEESPSELLYREYPELKKHVTIKLYEKGLAAADYELIPVHPWQFHHTLPVLYKDVLQNHDIVPIADFSIKAAALVSFRSLAPVQKRAQHKHHIKTAINIQTTSAVRTVSPASTMNGPHISKLLTHILNKENRFNNRFIMLEEKTGIYYSPLNKNLSEDEKTILGKNLASIFRENPENHLEEDEVLMPAAALIAKSPVSGQYVIEELIDQFAETHQISNRNEAAVSFMERYVENSLPGFLTMMSRYGISLEGHLQNSVPVFKNGALVKIIVRDYGGIRILKERLERQHLSVELAAGSAILTENADELRNVFSHAIFQNHLGELIACLVRTMEIEEEQLWKPIIKVCKSVFNELKQDSFIKEQAYEDEKVLFSPTLELKALATMRLLDDITDYSYTKVPNPLNALNGGE
jgi:siderophore synthetase component